MYMHAHEHTHTHTTGLAFASETRHRQIGLDYFSTHDGFPHAFRIEKLLHAPPCLNS